MQQFNDLLHTTALRQKLKKGEPCLGLWLTIGDTFLMETLAADCQVDWLQIDMEHNGLNEHDLKNMMFGWKDSLLPVLIRVPSHNPGFLGRMLDLGASGVVVPFVNTAEEASKVAAACRYPPKGTRGFGPRRATHHYTKTDEYFACADQSVFVMVQIEHVKGLENVESIAQVPGIDALFIGPGDLSFSLGIPMQWEHPKLVEAVQHIVQVGKKNSIPVAMAVDEPPETVVRWFQHGINMATIGVDWGFMRQAINQSANEFYKLMETAKNESLKVSRL